MRGARCEVRGARCEVRGETTVFAGYAIASLGTLSKEDDDGSENVSLRTADAFPVGASLPPKNNYFSEGEKRRPEMRLLFAGYENVGKKNEFAFFQT